MGVDNAFDSERNIADQFAAKKIKEMPISEYSEFLWSAALGKLDGVTKMNSEKVEVMVNRYEGDINTLLENKKNETQLQATRISEGLGFLIFSLASKKVEIDSKVIEKFYSLLENDNEFIKRRAIEYVPSLVSLDFQNKEIGKNFLGLYDRFGDDLVRKAKNPDLKKRSIVEPMLTMVYADFGQEARDNLLERIGIKTKTETKVKDDPYSLMFNFIKSGNLDDEARESVGSVLSGWKEAFDKSRGFEFKQDRTEEMEANYWDKKSMGFRLALLQLVSNKNKNTKNENELLLNLSKDPGFDKKNLLANYLAYEVWFASRTREEGQNSFKEKIYPNIKEITINLLHEGKTTDIDKYINYFSANNETSFADLIIVDKRLNFDEKMKFMVCFMNQFGLVKGIDFLASNINKSDDLKKVYDRFEGKELKKRFVALETLYSDVDFEKYNSEEFTKKEVNLIKSEVAEFSNKNDCKVKAVNILDIGAGTGRHSVALFQEGYKITALEVQSNHIAKIKSKEPKLKIIPESWSDLSLDLGIDSFDFAYCLERTALHNRTPQDMLRFFDNVSGVLSKKGRLMIDFADISVGEYKERVDGFKNNLKDLGVKETMVNHIFDGVDDDHQFNRMAPNKEQIDAYSKLVGLKLVKEAIADVVEKDGEITNNYYVFEKDPEFKANNLSNTLSLFKTIGIYDEGVDYNQMVKSLGMTIGQVMIYGVNNEEVRLENKQGGPSPVTVFKDAKGRMYLSSTLGDH